MKTLSCPIRSKEYLNSDTRRLILERPEPATFDAGQYLQIVTPEKKYPFSIASSPRETDIIELHIRPTPGSADSDRIEAVLDDAEILDIEIPLGDCFIKERPVQPLVMLAASTGITQMKSIIEFLEPEGFEQPVYLYWGVLADKDLYLDSLCQDWQARHSNFHYIPVVSEPTSSPEWQGRTGLVGEAALSDLDNVDNVKVIVSGGPAMVYATLDAFIDRGMPEANMQSDIFSYAPRPK